MGLIGLRQGCQLHKSQNDLYSEDCSIYLAIEIVLNSLELIMLLKQISTYHVPINPIDAGKCQKKKLNEAGR